MSQDNYKGVPVRFSNLKSQENVVFFGNGLPTECIRCGDHNQTTIGHAYCAHVYCPIALREFKRRVRKRTSVLEKVYLPRIKGSKEIKINLREPKPHREKSSRVTKQFNYETPFLNEMTLLRLPEIDSEFIDNDFKPYFNDAKEFISYGEDVMDILVRAKRLEGARKGGLVVKERYGSMFFEVIGRYGGNKVKRERGPEYYSEIGRRGRHAQMDNGV